MKTMTKILSLAIVGGGLTAGVSAQADTVYHRVYHQPVTISDPFSILDQYQNNNLTPEEYRKSADAGDFATMDTDDNGFISRSEFYGAMAAWQNTSDLTLITPAAGGDMTTMIGRSDIVYRNDPCDVNGRRDDADCR
jgi:hypothetical protein